MKRWLVIIMGIITGLCLSGNAETMPFTRVKVLKDNCNLRAKALVTSEVVGQVSANDILTAKSINNEWVEVVPPTNIDLWILGDYVKDGAINCSQKVNVRAGAGINFNIVGQLPNGEKVEVRGTHAEWIKIAPLPICSLWISRPLVIEVPANYVEPAKVEPVKLEQPKAEPVKPLPGNADELRAGKPEAGKPTPVEAKTAAPAVTVEAGKPEVDKPVAPAASPAASKPTPVMGKPVPTAKLGPATTPVPAVAGVMPPKSKPKSEVKPPISVPPPSEPVASAPVQASLPSSATAPSGVFSTPPGLDLVPNTEQGRWREVEGILRPKAFFFRVLSDFRLVSCEEGDKNSVTICYVKGNHAQLEALMFKHLIISGREYWVKRQKYPVIVPERIVIK